MAGKKRPQREDDEEFDPKDPKRIKRQYKKVSIKKSEKLVKLVIQEDFNIRQAGRKLRINDSNAKVIVRKARKALLKANTECNSSVKQEEEVKVENEEAINEQNEQEAQERTAEVVDQQPSDYPLLEFEIYRQLWLNFLHFHGFFPASFQ